MKDKKTFPKIELVACAKDEAAYLPEWIFYHLSIGFSRIKIYINNTSDNSAEVLDKIIAKHPEVSYIIADNLISNPPSDYHKKTNVNFFKSNRVQAVAYTDALANNTSNCDFTAFLDVDEFFYPYKPLTDIFQQPNSKSLPIRFNWLLLSGDTETFCSLAKCSKGFMDNHFKSVVPRNDQNFRAEDPHSFSLNGHIGYLSIDAVILHRVLRSSTEYLFLLSRSSSNSKNHLVNGFKRNRRGWTSSGVKIRKYKVNIKIDYAEKLQAFIDNCDINSSLNQARKSITEKAKILKQNIANINEQNIELTRSLNGLDIKHFSFAKTFFMSLFWKSIHLISPRMILSHETIKESLLSKLGIKSK